MFFLHMFSLVTFGGGQNGANVWPGVETVRAYFSYFFRVYFSVECCQITSQSLKFNFYNGSPVMVLETHRLSFYWVWQTHM